MRSTRESACAVRRWGKAKVDKLLEIEGLRTEIDGLGAPTRAVDGITLDIERGETFALVGESGCGKSMTALSIMRLLPEAGHIASGEVRVNGTDLLALPESQMRDQRGRRIAMIFQEPATSLNAVMTVGRQIEEVLERHLGLSGEAARARAQNLLEAVGVPDAARRLGEYPFQLSGGLKQRVMIAMALAAEPEILVADEPTTALDVTIQAQVLDLLKKLQVERGMAILLITHDLGIVAGMANRVAVMYAGEIVEIASRDSFFTNPQHPYSRKLFASLPGAGRRGEELAVIPGQVPPLNTAFRGCRFADRCEQAHARCRDESPGWTGLQGKAAHKVRCHWIEDTEKGVVSGARSQAKPSNQSPIPAGICDISDSGKSLLRVGDLKVHFPIRKGVFKHTVGHVRAVDGVSLEVAAGKTLALVGESGCGKTTVGKAILQLIRPTAGEVLFDGVDLTQLRGEALRLRRREFQIIFQDPYASLNPRMRVEDILLEGMSALGVGDGQEARRLRLDQLLDQVGLPQSALTRYPHEFSGGQRQRIAIARALAVEPRLIICDEPTSALDVSVQAQILNLLARLQRELGLAYLFITHNLAVVEYLAHEVAVMYLGRIVERGTANEVLGSPKHPYTQALLSAVPRIDAGDARAVIKLEGELPSPVNPPTGCHFHPRCREVRPECREHYPAATPLSSTHGVACWLHVK
ncbi:MAG: ABC transporter ATP-binding protein [Betaproteobacteria bacterium]|nr:ABC transporter ATP-binding protein [Betaproteobacteria bacterium]